MSVWVGIAVSVLTLVLMEGVTWLTHRFVMHGFLWSLHKDHHQPVDDTWFEKNDLFFLIFALPSMLLMYFGLGGFLFYIGLGICLYGACYFLIHDVVIHQRFKWFTKLKWRYLQALRKGHKRHHKN